MGRAVPSGRLLGQGSCPREAKARAPSAREDHPHAMSTLPMAGGISAAHPGRCPHRALGVSALLLEGGDVGVDAGVAQWGVGTGEVWVGSAMGVSRPRGGFCHTGPGGNQLPQMYP